MRRIIYAVLICAVSIGCAANNRATVGGYSDAALVAEQRIVIEQQQQRFEDMGRIVGEVQSDLGRAVDAIVSGIEGNADSKSQFAIIDQFVRSVIESKRRLEELQSANWGEDAGE